MITYVGIFSSVDVVHFLPRLLVCADLVPIWGSPHCLSARFYVGVLLAVFSVVCVSLDVVTAAAVGGVVLYNFFCVFLVPSLLLL